RVARNRGTEYAEDSKWRSVGKPAMNELKEDGWLAESEQIARTTGYDSEVLGIIGKLEVSGEMPIDIELSERYLKTGGAIAERRLVEAGYRLGAVLKTLLSGQ